MNKQKIFVFQESFYHKPLINKFTSWGGEENRTVGSGKKKKLQRGKLPVRLMLPTSRTAFKVFKQKEQVDETIQKNFLS